MSETSDNLTDKPRRTANRRRFFKYLVGSVGGLAGASLAYTFLEAGWVRLRNASVQVPNLPRPFSGLKVALLTDIHHGPHTSLEYVQKVVRLTNTLAPDLTLLGGDYVHRDGGYIAPCFEALSHLRAGHGVFGVLGNHDHWQGARKTKRAMKSAGIVELTNSGVWLQKEDARLRLAGVGDLWEDEQDLWEALADTKNDDAAILISHNPDFAENIRDRRVGLVLSGHTHGGQVVFPVVGAPLVPSQYGQKYLHGLVQAPMTQAFVSRGLGTVTPPVRFCCRPEIVLITLTA